METGSIRAGPAHSVTLAEARERARTQRLQLLDGVDPLAAKRGEQQAAKLAAARGVTFDECVSRYYDAHKSGWRNARHARDWLSTLRRYVCPILGELPVAAIDTALVVKVVEPLWSTKTVTAARVRARIEAVLDWAKVRGLRQGENPARLRGHFDHILPDARSVARVRHFVALPHAEVPAFMARLREVDGPEAACLEFLILAAARLSEACGALWAEINLTERVWVIPGTRMKANREHRVALPDRAIAILARQRAETSGPNIFGGRRPLPSHRVWKLCKQIAGDHTVTVHGFRSAFRDWTAERTSYPREVAD